MIGSSYTSMSLLVSAWNTVRDLAIRAAWRHLLVVAFDAIRFARDEHLLLSRGAFRETRYRLLLLLIVTGSSRGSGLREF